jgi:hypothetical protein
VIHELLVWYDPEGSHRLTWNNVDWGSQSIAQSKFQRTAPRRGKDFKENIRILVRQPFSRSFRKKFYEGTLGLLLFRSARPRLARDVERGDRKNEKRNILFKTFLLGQKLYVVSAYSKRTYAFVRNSDSPDIRRLNPTLWPRARTSCDVSYL